MASTKESIILVASVWTDLYAVTGIEVGTKIAVHNIASSDIQLSSALIQPEDDSDSWQIVQPNNFPMTNDFGDQGAWARSPHQDSKLQVWAIP